MCEFSEKLIAWLDQELTPEAVATIERHVLDCAQCQREVRSYRKLGETIDAYCELALASKAAPRSKRPVWRRAYAAPSLAAAALLLFLLTGFGERLRLLFSPRPEGAPAIARKAPEVPAMAMEKISGAALARGKSLEPAKPRRLERKPAPQTVLPGRNANWLPNESPVYIAIPADALFPPGAFPEGVGFVADVNLRPDGSAQRLRLQPQLVGFQTRGTRP